MQDTHSIRGLIFDFDGLILDTEMPAYQAWQEIYDEHGCEFPFSTWVVCIGGAGGQFDEYAYLETASGRVIDREALRSRRARRKLELTAVQCILPGVLDYIREAKRLGLKLGVASSSPRSWVEEHLARLGILKEFDSIICSEDAIRVKPDPELYLLALAALGLRPEEAIALEDSPNGITAAKGAGIFCVAVPNPVTRGLALDHAGLRLGSLKEMPLQALLRHVQPEPLPAVTPFTPDIPAP